MEWINELLFRGSVANTILIYCLVIAVGVSLGRIKITGISLGITFVLFCGLALGHFGFSPHREVAEFIKDFGLILFVFSIGIQVGPAFFSSFKKGGLSLNLLAMVIVLTGSLITLLIHYASGMPLPDLVGVMSGAVTNTPGLGAAQQTLSQLHAGSGTQAPEISLGYAVAYPFGVLGIMVTMLFIRKVFRINVPDELSMINQDQYPPEEMPERVNIFVSNPSVYNMPIQEYSGMFSNDIVVSRILHNGELLLPSSDSIIRENDIILVVARKGDIDAIVTRTGTVSEMDLTSKTGRLISKRIIVTSRDIAGKTIGTLKLRSRLNVNITRVHRAGIELVASKSLRIQLGDKLTVVGDEKSIEEVIKETGNSVKHLNEPNIIPIFIGILLGIIVGSIPLHIPGVTNPVKLGLAGGPLIIAILLSRYGYRFSLITYTTPSANLMLREVGIVLFLASVGLMAGEKFIPALTSGDGLRWLFYGAIITLIPLLFTGLFARYFMKRNFIEICGLLSGSMTDPPALAFANGLARSEAPAVAYATVYPLVMFLRIFSAQFLILFFT